MKINSLKLTNFRKLKDFQIEFSPNYNLILGENATGKTSIIEAIYFASFLNSFRSNNSRDLINFNEESSMIEIDFNQENEIESNNKLQLNFNAKNKKIFLNKREISQYKEIFNQINLIVISPNNIDLINSSPKIRRKYLDQAISQIDSLYLDTLIKYKKILKMKNKYLKEVTTQEIDMTYYNLITEQLLELNNTIVKKRQKYLKEITRLSNDILKRVVDEKEDIDYVYKQEARKISSTELLNTELKYKNTAFGAHLDDFKIKLNTLEVKTFGSQGQKRLVAIAFFLSQNKLMEETKKSKPIIVFDDVHLDLDENKQQELLKYINHENQIIYITTDLHKIEFLQKYNPQVIKLL